MFLLKDSSGLSLIAAMTAMSIAVAAAMVLPQTVSQLGVINQSAAVLNDRAELYAQMRMILDNEQTCRLSLAGEDPLTSPVSFQKMSIDEPDSGEGLDVEFWLGDQAGTARTDKVFSGTDPANNQLGSLTIQSIKLTAPHSPTAANYADSSGATHSAVGAVRVTASRPASSGITVPIVQDFAVQLTLITDASGVSTVHGCRRALNGGGTLDCTYVMAPASGDVYCGAGYTRVGCSSAWSGSSNTNHQSSQPSEEPWRYGGSPPGAPGGCFSTDSRAAIYCCRVI